MKLLIALLLGFFCSMAAQAQETHYMGTKGEVVDFDTAVIISLPAYRAEQEALKAKELLIDSLQMYYHFGEKNQQSIMAEQELHQKIEGIAADLSDVKKEIGRRRWFTNPLLFLGAGMLIGVYFVD